MITKLWLVVTCALLAILISAVLAIVTAVKAPVLSLQQVSLARLSLQDITTARVAFDITLEAGNPNSWPLDDLTLESGQVDVFSADISNPDPRDDVFLGTVLLPEPVRVTNESRVNVTLRFKAFVKGGLDSLLYLRWLRDCNPLAAAQETRFRFHVKKFVAKAIISLQAPWNIDLAVNVGCHPMDLLDNVGVPAALKKAWEALKNKLPAVQGDEVSLSEAWEAFKNKVLPVGDHKVEAAAENSGSAKEDATCEGEDGACASTTSAPEANDRGILKDLKGLLNDGKEKAREAAAAAVQQLGAANFTELRDRGKAVAEGVKDLKDILFR